MQINERRRRTRRARLKRFDPDFLLQGFQPLAKVFVFFGPLVALFLYIVRVSQCFCQLGYGPENSKDLLLKVDIKKGNTLPVQACFSLECVFDS